MQTSPFTDPSITVPEFVSPDPTIIAAARQIPTATLHEAAGRIGALPSAIKPLVECPRIAGPAFTVQGPAGDNLWIHRALAVADAGTIIVVSAHGAYETGYWGEIMSTAGRARGLAGIIIDGCARDSDLLRSIGFPVFARGVCIRGPNKDLQGAGSLNQPILIGQVSIEPGDLIVADTDGVVALPNARLAAIIDAAKDRETKEADVMRRIALGERTIDIFGWNR